MKNEAADDFHYSFAGMLISIFIILVIGPLAPGIYGSIVISACLGLILISSVFALASHRYVLWTGATLGISSLFFLLMDFLASSWWIHLFSMINSSLVIGLTTLVHFKTVFHPKKYTTNTLFGAVCVFLLLGFFFSLLYGIIEHLSPDSFLGFYKSVPASQNELNLGEMFQNFLYYSFVTQTTLGYGDIVPQTYLTQNLAIMQAIIGQFYIAVLVAGMIGKVVRNKD